MISAFSINSISVRGSDPLPGPERLDDDVALAAARPESFPEDLWSIFDRLGLGALRK